MSVGNSSFHKQVADKKNNVCGALSQASHEIGIPVRAVGNVDADIVAIPSKLLLQIAPYAVQHLEFERVFRDISDLNEFLRGLDYARIVSRNRGIDALFKQSFAFVDYLFETGNGNIPSAESADDIGYLRFLRLVVKRRPHL